MLKKIISVSSILIKKVIPYLFILPWLPITRANDPLLLDKVIATVDQELILHSELEETCKQLELEGKVVDASVKMKLLRELVLNKIFLAKAMLNDVKIPKGAIQRECDYTIAAWVQRVGSEAKLTDYFHQSIYHIKKELKRRLKTQYLVASVHQNLTQQVVVTPAEVKTYFDALPPHQRPYYPASFEVRQLVVYPKVALARKEAAKRKLLDLKQSLMEGAVTFSELAKQHSDDPGSASKGGEVGWVPLGVLALAYESAALALKVGQISDPIASGFGLHLIMLIGRRKDQYNTRHILQVVQPTKEEIALAEVELNQIRTKIVTGTLTFEAAVQHYSEDKECASEGGLITAYNQEGALLPSLLIPAEALDPEVYFVVDALEEGAVSKPQYMGTQHRSGWRLLYLKQKVAAHPMNLTQDYEKIHHHLLEQKKKEVVDQWMQTAKSEFVITFAPEYQPVEQLL